MIRTDVTDESGNSLLSTFIWFWTSLQSMKTFSSPPCKRQSFLKIWQQQTTIIPVNIFSKNISPFFHVYDQRVNILHTVNKIASVNINWHGSTSTQTNFLVIRPAISIIATILLLPHFNQLSQPKQVEKSLCLYPIWAPSKSYQALAREQSQIPRRRLDWETARS